MRSFKGCYRQRKNDRIFKADRYKGEKSNDPLGRLEYDEDSNKYFCEMNEHDKKERNIYFDKECVKFILNNIWIWC